MPATSDRVMPDPLREWTVEIFRRLNLPEEDAKFIAQCLVQVDLRGVFTHGTRQLRRYVREYSRGDLNPRPEIKIVRETGSSTVLDGDGGAGYLVAKRATEILIEKAQAQGIAISSTQFHGHVGSEGIYARMALEHGLINFSVAGGRWWEPPNRPNGTIWDAMRSPPMCFGIPTSSGPPLVLDMNANFFGKYGREQLEDAMLNHPGPIFKTMGLRFVSWILGGGLAGDVEPSKRISAFPAANRGFLIVAFSPDTVGSADAFREEVSRILTACRDMQPIKGQSTAETPGSLEWQREQDWAKEGIPMGEEQKKLLEEVAINFSVEVPW